MAGTRFIWGGAGEQIANEFGGDYTELGYDVDDGTLVFNSKGTKKTLASTTDVTGSTSNLLSATHADTVAASPVRGDLLVGNSTPAWTKLAKGSSGTVLTMGANDPAWTAPSAYHQYNVLGLSTSTTLTAGATDVFVTNSLQTTGTITVTLPTAAAGLTYHFITLSSGTLSVAAGASDQFLSPGGTTSATQASVDTGSSLTVIAADSTSWVITRSGGTWA